MPSGPKRRPLLIDTDTGVDDAMAILYALRSPEADVVAITTVAGNVEVHKCTRNVRAILNAAGISDGPQVVEGSSRPLRYPLVTAPEVHGDDGLGNTQKGFAGRKLHTSNAAIRLIRDLCDRYEQKLTIAAIGPLTNIAKALSRYPRSLRKVGRIVTMGGAFRVPGNTGPVAEFNYFVDPHAANLVLSSGLPITIVPLDITEQFILMRTRLRQIVHKRPGAMARLILRATGPYMAYHLKTLGMNGGYLHDPLAVAIAVNPSLARVREVHVEVECQSHLTRGMTVADFRKPGIKTDPVVVTGVKREQFLNMFYQRVFSYRAR